MSGTTVREMLPGLHVEYDSKIPHKKAEAVIEHIAKNAPVRDFIAKNPVHVLLSKSGSNSASGGGSHGTYKPARTLAGMKMAPTIGVHYIERKPSSVIHSTLSSKAPDAMHQMQTTLLHEVGHHVHASTDRASFDTNAHPSFDKARGSGQVSMYAGKDHREHFAENFTAMHTMSPAEHARRDPAGHAMIHDVAAKHGFRPDKPPGGGEWDESKHPRDEDGKFG